MMKKAVKVVISMAVIIFTIPAVARNMEDPLYLPGAVSGYSQTTVGMMTKVIDDSEAMKDKLHDGATEFPIWRVYQSLGYGITDWLTIRGAFAYTYDGDIDRQGMHLGRIGLDFRIFNGKDTSGIVWDVYTDAHLGGISKMTGALVPSPKLLTGQTPSSPLAFNYDNYSNGRWGLYAGTQVGKAWSKVSGALFFEILQTFGNHNNEIDVTALAALGTPYDLLASERTISVNLKSTTEWNIGIKGLYQFNELWSLGGAFTYKHHADNGVKSVEKLKNSALQPIANELAIQMKNMEDGFDEYIIGLVGGVQLNKYVQVLVFGEYTFDTAHKKSQNGTDLKMEFGFRLNLNF